MKIFVTGGAGFIGKYLVKSLIHNQHKVTIFDNFSNSLEETVSDFVKKGVKIIKGDIRNIDEISSAIKNHEIVIHLAAKISVEESIKNPRETFDVNIQGTKNVLTACLNNKINKIIISSSAAVYGESEPKKLNENSIKKPISPYGESKMKMEEEITKFCSIHKINFIILRFFNIFGVGQSDEYAGVITKFRNRILQNNSLEIFGDGNQTRDFVAIEDVVSSINQAVKKISKQGIYNIASGNAISIKYLAELMISKSGKKLKINFLQPKKGDIKHSQADITLAKKNIGYNPRFSIDEKIKEML